MFIDLFDLIPLEVVSLVFFLTLSFIADPLNHKPKLF